MTNNLQKIINKETTQKERRTTLKMKHKIHKRKLINNIKKKMNQNHLIISKVDKGNTAFIIHGNKYNKNVEEFTLQYNFTRLPHDITNKQ
jgi:hypothetical protein